jgi:hypothetical protein
LPGWELQIIHAFEGGIAFTTYQRGRLCRVGMASASALQYMSEFFTLVDERH